MDDNYSTVDTESNLLYNMLLMLPPLPLFLCPPLVVMLLFVLFTSLVLLVMWVVDMDLDVNDDIWSPMSTVLHSGKKSESSSALNTDYAPTPATTPGVTDSNYSTFGRSIL